MSGALPLLQPCTVSGHGGTKGANFTKGESEADRVHIAVEIVSRRNSANHLVRLEEERRGKGEAQVRRDLEIDHQLELCGLLDW